MSGPTVQPALTPEGDVLVSAPAGMTGALRRLVIDAGPNGWTATEQWTSSGLKPYFNDFVVHNARLRL